jgi:hypothetical protein
MTASLHPAAPHHLPAFIADPGGMDVLMVVMAVFLVVAVLAVGLLFLRLHTLPERMAHKSQKIQFEIVAVLGLLALFTHMHIFWVIGLLLALIDLPDLGWPLRRMAGSLEKMAGIAPGQGAADVPNDTTAGVTRGERAAEAPDERIADIVPREEAQPRTRPELVPASTGS